MNRSFSALALAGCLALGFAPMVTRAETAAEEGREHPRIVKAIHELEDAVRYMEAAPHDFGGHKAEAIQASRRAIEQLRLALHFRAAQDTKHGK